MQVYIKNLIDDVQCYQTVRELRWPDGIQCPSCDSQHVIKRVVYSYHADHSDGSKTGFLTPIHPVALPLMDTQHDVRLVH